MIHKKNLLFKIQQCRIEYYLLAISQRYQTVIKCFKNLYVFKINNLFRFLRVFKPYTAFNKKHHREGVETSKTLKLMKFHKTFE